MEKALATKKQQSILTFAVKTIPIVLHHQQRDPSRAPTMFDFYTYYDVLTYVYMYVYRVAIQLISTGEKM